MICKDLNRGKQGSITVFLSVSLLLILSLVFTIIEGARLHSTKLYVERALTTAMDSVLAEFYGPLWKEYHIFAYDLDNNREYERENELTTKLKEYMFYTLYPNLNMDQRANKSLDLYDINITSIDIMEKAMLTDYQGELFVHQAVEYMKYHELANALELLLDKMSLLESPQKVSILYEEKQQLEEELVMIDEGILELMELLDGIKTGKKGLEVTKEGKPKTVTNFVKRLCFTQPSQEAVGIHTEAIFLSLKSLYHNPSPEFELIRDSLNHLKILYQQIDEIEAGLSTLEEAILTKKLSLEGLKAITEKTDEDKKMIEGMEEELVLLEEEHQNILHTLEELNLSQQIYLDHINAMNSSITAFISSLMPCNSKAIEVIQGIIDQTNKAGPMIQDYEKKLDLFRADLGDEVYLSLEEDLNTLKKYTEINGQGYDFPGMLESLEQNLSVLSQVEGLMLSARERLQGRDLQGAETLYQAAESVLLGYKTEQLVIDYSTIVLDKKNEQNPLSSAASFLQEGLLSLIIDSQNISKGKLEEQQQLPSMLASMYAEEEGFLDKLTEFFQSAIVGSKKSGLGGVFGSFGQGIGSIENLSDGINKLGEYFLFQEYLSEHFYMFPKEGEALNTRKPSVLRYEQEYLLVGKDTDEANLGSVISRIIFLRTILDFVSILTDKDKCLEANLAASALVGFTGLPILVSITKTLILLYWSFVEALVDTCALMQGKEVPILKKNINVTFPEIFLINRSFLQQKAESMKNTKELTLSYHDYLRIFLLTHNRKDLIYRSLDLIQENIRLRYQDNFMMKDCLFGFKAQAEFEIPSRFTAFTFVQERLQQSPKGYKFSISGSYSY